MRGKSLLWMCLIALLLGPLAMNHIQLASATTTITYLYVNSFSATNQDWNVYGTSPYLNAIDYPLNYIEGNDAGQLIGIFGFDDITLGPFDTIVSVRLEGYTQTDDLGIDIDVYEKTVGPALWLGSLWGDPSWNWKSPRWTTQSVSDLDPTTKTKPGLDAFQVRLIYYTGSGESLGNAAIDALRLEVTMETEVSRSLGKAIDPPDGSVGDIVHITIIINIPPGDWGVNIVDTLPPELLYVPNSFLVNNIPDTPNVVGPPPQQISYSIIASGIYTYTIEFKAQVTSAYSQDRTVFNVIVGYWIDEYGSVVDVKEASADFVIHPRKEFHENVGIPKADIVFAIDISGSMGGVLAAVKPQATNIMTNLAAQIVNVQFGLIYFMDYTGTYYTNAPSSIPPIYNEQYGRTLWGDTPYKLEQPITSNTAAVAMAINGLAAGSGEDVPEDYTRIIYESYADPSVGWRSGAKRFLILFGDSPAHDSDFDYDNDGVNENWGGDPGRDEILGNFDDLDFETEVASAANAGIRILAVYCGNPSPAAYQWQYMATETDGGFYQLTGVSHIPYALKELVKEQAEDISSPIKEKKDFQWAIVLDIVNPFPYTMTDVEITDHFGVQIEIDPPFPCRITHGTATYITRGAPKKAFLTWNVGNLLPGETARIMFLVSTCMRKGKQEYIEPGVYEINSGAHLKFTDPTLNTRLSAVTAPIIVTVLPQSDP